MIGIIVRKILELRRIRDVLLVLVKKLVLLIYSTFPFPCLLCIWKHPPKCFQFAAQWEKKLWLETHFLCFASVCQAAVNGSRTGVGKIMVEGQNTRHT